MLFEVKEYLYTAGDFVTNCNYLEKHHRNV